MIPITLTHVEHSNAVNVTSCRTKKTAKEIFYSLKSSNTDEAGRDETIIYALICKSRNLDVKQRRGHHKGKG